MKIKFIIRDNRISKNHKRYGKSGFSLIELMMVLAIIAILAIVSIKYNAVWIKKSRKSEAKANLAYLATAVEEYKSIYGRYCPDCNDTNTHIYTYAESDNGTVTSDNITSWIDFKPKQASDSSVIRYNYKIAAKGDTEYQITATPVTSRQVSSDILTINQDGVKTDGSSNSW